jgi:2-iminobutanoate/2-iminopropanoate deaminase
MRSIATDDAPAPAGHYAQAVEHDGVLYVAGQLPIVPGAPPGEPGEIEEQTTRCLENIRAILRAAGADLHDVLKTTVYVSDIALWPRVNAAYARVFGKHRPARAVVPCGVLHHGYQVEIDAIACVARGARAAP